MGADANPSPHLVSYFSGCMASPSWLPAKHRGPVGGRFHLLARDGRPAGWCGRRAWRKLLRRLAQESKCICSSPMPVTFGYDAASYAKNFEDDGPAPSAFVVATSADKPTGR